jgi:rare lipoprotein A
MKGLIQFFALLMITTQVAWATPPTEKGLAKFYDDSFHGRQTASGATYDKNKLTAAHKSLPFGTKVKVLNPANGKSVIVEINDRGPYVKGRIIELSKRAADQLSITKQATVPVVLTVVDKGTVIEQPAAVAPKVVEKVAAAAAAPKPQPKVEAVAPVAKKPVAAAVTKPKTVTKTAAAAQSKPVQPAPKKETKTTATAAAPAKKKAAPVKKKTPNLVVAARDMKTGGFYKMQVLKLQAKGYGVQIAGYSDYQSVTQQLFAIQKNWFKGATVFVDELNGQPYYKIILGPLNTKAEAESYRKSLIKKYGTKDAFVVDVAALSEAKNKTNSATSSDGNLLEEAKKMTAGGYYKMQVLQLESKGYGVQAMGYSDYQAVVNQLAVLQENWFSGAAIFVDELNGKPYYKIILGATDTKEKAANYAANLKKKYESMKGAFVVDITALTKKK